MNKLLIILLLISFMFRQIITANSNTYINSKNITYNEVDNIIELSENSKINFKNNNILVDRGIIDYKNNKFEVFGNFYLYQDLNILSGFNLVGDTNLDSFKAENVSYIYNNELKIDADKIYKNADYLYFYNNFITPCEIEGVFNCPTWSIRVDETKYDLNEDKYTHYDSFLQIADYKLMYLPYFSHYGAKAPRKKGFLTPSIVFNLEGGTSLKTPYYYPLNQSTDFTITPIIKLSSNLNLTEEYEQKIDLSNKSSGGYSSINIHNSIKSDNSDIFSSIKLSSSQVINKNNKILLNGVITNSISTTRSNNDQPLTFEDIYIRMNSYDIFKKNDFLLTEISTVQAFDNIDDALVPITPNLTYLNNLNFNRNISLLNTIDLQLLKRDESNSNSPSEIKKINSKNIFHYNYKIDQLFNYNKLVLINEMNDYIFEHNPNLNYDSFDSSFYLSSDFYYELEGPVKPRIKFISFNDIYNDNDKINENSNSITFNYNNLFSENRLYGNDLKDKSNRVSYGLEGDFDLIKNKINIRIGQSYDTNKNNEYLNKINQQDNISDYAYEIKTNINEINFKINGRLDQNNFSKKEMGYYFNIKKPIDLGLTYNETSKDSFKDLSDDTQSLNIVANKNLSNHISMSFSSSLDLKNNYSPFKSSLSLNLFDECSKLELTYSQIEFNDNFNTIPEEKISITFYMDYLGFFNVDNMSNVF